MNPEDNASPIGGSPSLSPSEPSSLKQIRTFQGDVAEALKNQNESLVSIQAKEVARTKEITREIEHPKATEPELPVIAVPARKEPLVTPPRVLSPEEIESKHKRNQAFLLGLGTLILLGGGVYAGWAAYKEYKVKTFVPMAEVIPNSFISSDSMVEYNSLDFDREGLIAKVQEERAGARTGITHIELKKGETVNASLLTTEELLVILQSEAPGRLVRAFDPLFMLGVLGDAPRHTFLFIKLDSFDNAFSGMLEWERTLAHDMLPLFASPGVVEVASQGVTFSDITIKNKDARVLKDVTGHTVLLYSFVDNKYLLITDDEETFKTILTRITAEKLVR
jgi:hypothetical protein